MKTQELRQLIREEARNMLTESFKLPTDYTIVHIDGKRYTIEYSKYGMEPTIAQLEKATIALRKLFEKIADKIQAGPLKGEAHVYVRGGDVAIGFDFTSKLNYNAMEKVYPRLDERD